MKNNGYFISTGEKNGFYTLKKRVFEPRYAQSSSGGWAAVGGEEKEVFFQNLSTDQDEALRKAKEITGFDLSIDFDLDDIQRLEAEEYARIRAEKQAEFDATDWSVFQFGKYAGRKIADVFAENPGYVEWFSGQFANTHRNSLEDQGRAIIIQHCIDLVAPVQAERKSKQSSEAQDLVAALGAETVAEVASREEDGFAKSVCSQLLGGSTISDKALNILVEIFAKFEGRRNSKAYNAAQDAIWDRISALYDEQGNYKQKAA